MRKFFYTLGIAALTASAAFAQVENPNLPTKASFNPGSPEEEYEEPFLLDGVDQTITVTFDKKPNVPVTVMYATGGSFNIGTQWKRIDADGDKVEIPLNRETWGIPYNEVYFLHLVVSFTYDIVEDGEVIPEYYLDADGNPVMFERIYYTPDTFPARLEIFSPNNQMFEQGFSFEEAYEAGVMYTYFSKSVTAPDDVATVTYYNLEGGVIGELDVQVIEQEWSDMDGLYQITFDYASEDVAVEDIARIEIQINPVTWLNPETDEYETITTPLIVLNNPEATPQAAPRMEKKGVANGLTVGTENVNVYNLQGMLVVKNASSEDVKNLAPGIYIINGRKVTVK